MTARTTATVTSIMALATCAAVVATAPTATAGDFTAGQMATPSSVGFSGSWKREQSSYVCTDFGLTKCRQSKWAPRNVQIEEGLFSLGSQLTSKSEAVQWFRTKVQSYHDVTRKLTYVNRGGARIAQITLRVSPEAARISVAMRGKRVSFVTVAKDTSDPIPTPPLPAWSGISDSAAWIVNPASGPLPTGPLAS